MTIPSATPSLARRFLRLAQGFDRPHASVADALSYHGYIQLDPINVCGRMHDLILRNRVSGYREQDLLRHLYGDRFETEVPLRPSTRRAFEQYLPGAGVLVAFPLEAWPHLPSFMEERSVRKGGYAGRLSAQEEQVARGALAELAARGPSSSDDLMGGGRASTAWGSRGRMVKTVLEKLFFHGRVLLTVRRGFRRIYDLPERVLPAALLNGARPSAEETRRWLILTRLRQRRLVSLKKGELPLVADQVQAIRIEGCPPVFCLRQDLPMWDKAAEEPAEPAPLQLLAPLDPLIYDRRQTRALWDLDYTWEVYTPAAKRVRGYYALPVLADTHFVGHVEPRADRQRNRLVLVSRRVKRGHSVRPALRELALFLGLRLLHRKIAHDS